MANIIDIKDFPQVTGVNDSDNILLSRSAGGAGKMTVALFRSNATATIKPSIKDGYWWIGSVNQNIEAKGKSPEFRKGELGIEWRYVGDIQWLLLVPYTDISLQFEDLSPSQISQLKLTFSDLTAQDIGVLQQPANDMIGVLQMTNNAMIQSEADRKSQFDALKIQIDAAIASADDTANNPTYIGSDYYVYRYDKATKTYAKTNIFVKGDGFKISKVFVSNTQMQAAFDQYAEGDFVLINTGSVEDPETGQLYVRGTTSWEFLTDMSGVQGFTGKTPQMYAGTVSTGAAGSMASVIVVKRPDDDVAGNPQYDINFVIPRGDNGLSAYQVAVSVGFVGTEQEWIESLSQDSQDAATAAYEAIDTINATNAAIELSESARVTAENERDSNETTRKEQEAKRVKDSAAAIDQVNLAKADTIKATQNAMSATDMANAAAERTETAIDGANSAATNAYEEADRAKAQADNPPKIETNFWYVYDEATGAYKSTGVGATGEAGKSPIIQAGTWWVYDNALGEYVNTSISVSSDYQLTKDKVEAVLTGTIDSHDHNSTYLRKDNTDVYDPTGDYNPSTKKYVDDKVKDAASKGYILQINNGVVASDAGQKVLEAYNNGGEIYVKYASAESLYKPAKIDVSGTTVILYILNLKESEGNGYTVIELTVGGTTIETYGKNVVNVTDRLDSQSTSSALSANQGKVLDESKVDKVTGKGLSTNDYSNEDKLKVGSIDADINDKIEAHNTLVDAHQDIRQKLSEVESIARGKSKGIVFNTVADLDAWLAVPANIATLHTGDNFYIKELNVPDYWWDGTKKQPLEGEKVDLSGYVLEAPIDGKVYGRKDESWAEVVDSPPEVYIGTEEPTGNETVWIDTDDTELFDEYAVPEAPIDDKQYARKNKGWVVVESIPLGETVLIKLNSNQTQPDDALNGAIIHVLYANVDDTFTWQGQDITATIPVNMTYQVACPTINGYKKPEDVEYIALAGNTRSVSFTYNTQKTTINVTADDGASVAEQTLTVTDVSDSTILYEGAAGTVVVNIPLATEYRVSVNDKAGYMPVEDQTLTASDASKTVDVVYEKIKAEYITLDQNISDPTGMITGDVNGIIIQNIRNNSHRYLGKFTASKNITICQIKDDDGTKYSDGTAAILTGADGDVFMRLPKFYYKATEVSTDVWNVGFALQQLDSTWKEWDGNDLIGVYEAYNSGTKIYSRSGVASTGNVSQSNFKAYARNRGDGYTLVKHKHQNIMAFLFYALYGNTNAQAVCGVGTNSSTKETGQTNLLGMVDTKVETNGNTMSINYWGLENWWGNKYEWEDNVLENPTADNGVWRITEDDGSTRDVQCATGSGYPKKMIVGEHLDTIVKEYGASDTTGFCDFQYTSGNGTTRVVLRSNNYASTNGGLVCAVANNDSSYTNSDYGSRLAFRGDITEASSVTAFKALPIIN